jgi:hypothetical protein
LSAETEPETVLRDLATFDLLLYPDKPKSLERLTDYTDWGGLAIRFFAENEAKSADKTIPADRLEQSFVGRSMKSDGTLFKPSHK